MKTKNDVRDYIAEKNPSLAKKIPGFVARYLNRILHLEEINSFMQSEKEGVDFVAESFERMGTKYRSINPKVVPKEGRFIFVANHPLGGLDGTVILKNVNELFGSAKFIVNDFLLNIPQLKDSFVGVNKHGGQTSNTLQKIEDLYKSDQHVLNFPAGLCSRKVKGKIVDLEWKKNFIQKAIRHERDIIPIFVNGKNSKKFYNISRIRTLLGIKANIEMLFLVDEMFKQKNTTITLTYGKPIPYSMLDKSKSYQEWAFLIKEHTYNLKNNPNKEFRI